MSSAERIREIREADLDIDDDLDIDFSKIRPPGDLRLWAFGLAIGALVLGGIGFSVAPTSYEAIAYSENWINERLQARLNSEAPIDGRVAVRQAEVRTSGDVFAVQALATDGERNMGVVATGALKVDVQSWVVRIKNPGTQVTDVWRDRQSTAESAAATIPDLQRRMPDSNAAWKATGEAVGFIENAARWTVGAVTSVARGDAMADIQFPGQAKRAVWEMVIINIPDADRAVMARGNVESIRMVGGDVVVQVKHWNLDFVAMICVVLIILGAALLGTLMYVPHFLTE